MEYYARACQVESNLCPARRSRGKRALLAVPSRLDGCYGRVNRILSDWGYRNISSSHCVRCRANLGPWRGCYCGWICLAVIDGRGRPFHALSL